MGKPTRLELLKMAMQAVKEEDYVGFCMACGAETSGVEPDACEYECEECGEHKVYGAGEIILMLA